jgi:hypothetical protein
MKGHSSYYRSSFKVNDPEAVDAEDSKTPRRLPWYSLSSDFSTVEGLWRITQPISR